MFLEHHCPSCDTASGTLLCTISNSGIILLFSLLLWNYHAQRSIVFYLSCSSYRFCTQLTFFFNLIATLDFFFYFSLMRVLWQDRKEDNATVVLDRLNEWQWFVSKLQRKKNGKKAINVFNQTYYDATEMTIIFKENSNILGLLKTPH